MLTDVLVVDRRGCRARARGSRVAPQRTRRRAFGHVRRLDGLGGGRVDRRRAQPRPDNRGLRARLRVRHGRSVPAVELRRAALALLGGVALVASAVQRVASQPVVAPTTQPPAGNAAYRHWRHRHGGRPLPAAQLQPLDPGGRQPRHPDGDGASLAAGVRARSGLPARDHGIHRRRRGRRAFSPMTVSYQIDPKATWSDGLPDHGDRTSPTTGTSSSRAAPTPGLGRRSGRLSRHQVDHREQSRQDRDGCLQKIRIPTGRASSPTLFRLTSRERGGWVAAFSGFDPADVISGGPFVVSSLIPGKRLVLTRNHQVLGRTGSCGEDRVSRRAVGSGGARWLAERDHLDRRGHGGTSGGQRDRPRP